MKPKRFRSLDAAMAWVAEHGAGRAVNFIVLHDDWCTHGLTSPCICSPEYLIEELTAESHGRAMKGTRAWLERHRRN